MHRFGDRCLKNGFTVSTRLYGRENILRTIPGCCISFEKINLPVSRYHVHQLGFFIVLTNKVHSVSNTRFLHFTSAFQKNCPVPIPKSVSNYRIGPPRNKLQVYQLFHHCKPQSPSGGGGLILRARNVVRL